MNSLFIINEFNVFRFLLAAYFGKAPYVLEVEAFFPPMQGRLQRLVDWLLLTGRVRDAVDLCPGLEITREFPILLVLHNIFAETENWQNHYYQFDAADHASPDYAMAYKLVVCNYTGAKHLTVLSIDGAAKALGEENIRIIGLPEDTAGLFEAYFGRPLPVTATMGGFAAPLFNLCTASVIMTFSLFWSLSRISFDQGKFERIFLLADFPGNRHDIPIFREVSDGGPQVLVPRVASVDSKEFRSAGIGEGAFTLSGGLAAVARAVRDGICLYRLFRWCPPGLFYQAAALPFRRIKIRALLTRFRPKYYWGRDSYNPEHILRRQELNRLGGQSHGIMSGYGGFAELYPAWRYVSYDRFYVFGRDIYEKSYKNTWAPDMEVVGSGSFSLTREDLVRLNRPKPNIKDIVIFTNFLAVTENAGVRDIVRALGAAFPDRTILLQVRGYLNMRQRESVKRFIRDCTEGLDNVVYAPETPYELIGKSKYAFSETSTVIMECIQFNVSAFMMDVYPIQKTSIFRNYPGLSVKTPEEAVARIRDIESGAWDYPRDELGGLVEMSGEPIYDIIRKGFGLPVESNHA